MTQEQSGADYKQNNFLFTSSKTLECDKYKDHCSISSAFRLIDKALDKASILYGSYRFETNILPCK